MDIMIDNDTHYTHWQLSPGDSKKLLNFLFPDRVLFTKEKGELAESLRYHSMDRILRVFVKKKLYSPTQLNRTTSPPQDSTENLYWHWRTAPPLHSTASTKREVPLSMFFNEVLECTKQACSTVEYR